MYRADAERVGWSVRESPQMGYLQSLRLLQLANGPISEKSRHGKKIVTDILDTFCSARQHQHVLVPVLLHR
jgi:hypothetical protein